MSNERNKETQAILKHEAKTLQSRCVDTCNIIKNTQDYPATNRAEVTQQALCYVEGLKTEIQNSNTTLLLDENLLTTQFLNEVREKTEQIAELVAFTKGTITDYDNEINRLKNQISIAQEAKSHPRIQKREITSEHIHKAKERFGMMKSNLLSFINSVFPDCAQLVIEFMGTLMAERLNQSTNGYVPITSENYRIIELLKDINIVTTNPYNNMEVKLAY